MGDVARARGMAQVAKDAGLWRESLDKALGVCLSVQPATL